MDSDERAWNLLAALSTLTALTLLLVVVDKPFRDPERPDDNDILTLADKLFIFSQVSQLVNYCIAAMCMMDEAQRMAEDGQRGTSDGVAMAAEVIGFILVGLQVIPLAYAVCIPQGRKEGEGGEDDEGGEIQLRQSNDG